MTQLQDVNESADSPGAVRGRWVVVLSGIFLAAVLGVTLAIRCRADLWVWPTLLAYGPRWPWLAPAAVLFLLSLAYGRSRVMAGIALVWVAVVLMQFNVPWPRLVHGGGNATLRICTFNTGDGSGLKIDRAGLAKLVADNQIDIVILEESHHRDIAASWPGDWRLLLDYDVTIITKLPTSDRELLTPEELDGKASGVSYRVETDHGPIRVMGVHLETPRAGFEALMHRKPYAWGLLERVTGRRENQWDYLGEQIRQTQGPLILAGDFNTVADSPLIRSNLGPLKSAFTEAGWGYGNSKFTGKWGARIDHVFHSDSWRAVRCWVGPDLGSDHRPLIAELQWVGP